MHNQQRHSRRIRIEQRRTAVADQYCSGRSQWQIAGSLGISQSQVSRDLAYLRRQWASSRGDLLDARVAEELAKIDTLEATAWRAWEESCRDLETRRVYQKGKLTIEEYTRKTQHGDPRLLERISWCIVARSRLLGLFPSRRVSVSATAEIFEDWEPTEEERRLAVERILAEVAIEVGQQTDSAPPPEPEPIPGTIDAD